MNRFRGLVVAFAVVAGLATPLPVAAEAAETPVGAPDPRTSPAMELPGSAKAPFVPAAAPAAEPVPKPVPDKTVDVEPQSGDLAKAPAPHAAVPNAGKAPATPFDPSTARLVDHTERADLYVMPDGTSLGRAYSRPVNFRGEDNRWQRIDTTLVRNGAGFRNAAGKLTYEFTGSTGGDDPLVSIRRDDWRIGFEPVGLVRGKAPVTAKNRITYRDALPGADVEYQVMPESLKEVIRLKHRPRDAADVTYRFPLALSGVTPRTVAGGTIEFVDVATDTVVASIPPGYAIDSGKTGSAAGDPAITPVRTALVRTASGWSVDVTVDGAWLAAKERVYPVLVDPQVNAGRQTGRSDMYVSSAQPNTTFAQGLQSDGARYYLKIGYLNGVEYDSYQWYDVAFANNTAILRGYWSGHFYQGNSTLPFTMWRLAEPFNPNPAGGTTFNTRPNHFIGEYDRLKLIACCGRMSNIDLTYWVSLWTHGSANHGIIHDTGGDTRVYDVMAADEMAYIGEDSYIDVYYNKTPLVPFSPSPANNAIVNDRSPVLSMTYQDADSPADNGSCTFQIYDVNFVPVPGADWFGSNPVTSGSRCTAESPVALENGRSYYWRANSIDFHGARSADSGWNKFTVVAHPVVTKTAPAGPFSRGQVIPYTVTLRNNSDDPLVISSVTDTLGTGLDAAAFSAACATATLPITCSYGTGTVTTTGFTLAANGGQQSFTVNAVGLGTDANCSPANNSVTAYDQAGSVTSSALPVQVCDARLGLESWWPYVHRALGPQAEAAVNVSNGNLVVTQTDTTPVQAHGRLAFVLRRTYNSQDTTKLLYPGSWGAGWTLNVGAVEGVGGVTGHGLSVPSVEQALRPLAVTLVDRDGTRHVFQPKALVTDLSTGLGGPIRVATIGSTGVLTPLATDELGTLLPRVLTAGANATTLCVDQLYTAPKGVHLGLWRYIRVNSTAVDACRSDRVPTLSPVVVGYAAMRPDRLRTEYSITGDLLEMSDANGVSLRYKYDSAPLPLLSTLGKLKTVYEATSACTAANVDTTGNCRKFTFEYPTTTQINVKDPAGRVTQYLFDGTSPFQTPVPVTPSKLTSVVNPADAAGVSTTITYNYGTCAVTGNQANANQLCSMNDPRGNTSRFFYTANVGPTGSVPYLTRFTDRRGTATNFSYASGQTTVTQSNRRQVFSGIDAAGRAAQLDEGTTAGSTLRNTTFAWDTAGCHLPDDLPGNDLCRTVVDSLYQTNPDGSYKTDPQTGQPLPSTTPDEDTKRVYSNEGALVMETKAGSSNGALTTSYGYHTQYVSSLGGVPGCLDLTPTGKDANGNPRVRDDQTSCQSRPDSRTVFAVTDQTASLTARGNAAPSGTAYQQYVTTYLVDNTGRSFNTAPSNGTCSGTAANTGNRCGVDAPADVKTRYTYDSYGQRLTMTSPKAIAETPAGQTPPATTYTYYADADDDMSGTTPTGGWLKAVTDPAGKFVVFGYDAAGNVVRTWDRNATSKAGLALSEYPRAWGAAPPSTEYTEQLYGCPTTTVSATCASSSLSVSRPWRYTRSVRDAIGNVTSFAVDNNGTTLVTRPPRGNAAGVATYDVTQSNIDAHGNVGTVTLPVGSNDGRSPVVPGVTSTTFDVFDNAETMTDANGHKTAVAFDAVNRKVLTRRSRTSLDALAPAAPACPKVTADAVFGTAYVCVTRIAYDGVGNVTAAQDANGQVAETTYDGVHRPLARVANRNGTPVRTEMTYDEDGHTLDTCSPREFDPAEPGSAGACNAGGRYSSHATYDVAGRTATSSTFRDTTGAANTSLFTYDANSNPRTTTDPRGTVVTTTYDQLDRLVAQATPRSSGVTSTRSWLYDAAGNMTAALDPITAGTSCVGVTSPSVCRITAYSYDGNNRVRDTVVGSDNVVATAAGLPSADGGSNIRTRVEYDADGRPARMWSARAFNSYGGLTDAQVRDNPNPAYLSVTTYDANGRVLSEALPRYDDANASHQGPGGAGTQTAQCPVPAAPTPFPAGVGVCTTHVRYDAVGNATLTTLPTSAGVDAAGAPLDAKYSRATYTDDNLLATLTGPSPIDGSHNTASFTQVYDGNGNVQRVVQPRVAGEAAGHELVMEYTTDNLLAREIDQADTASGVTHVTTYAYDAGGNQRTVTDGAGQVTTTSYFADGLVREECAYRVAGTGCEDAGAVANDRLRTTYRYDVNGNPEAVFSPSANTTTDVNNVANAPVLNTFTLDNLLLSSIEPVSPDGASRRRTNYAYDGLGRKTTQQAETVTVAPPNATTLASPTTVVAGVNGGTQSFTYYPSDRLATRVSRATSTANGIVAAGTVTMRYDADGNVVSAADTTAGSVGSCSATGRVTSSTTPALFCATYYLDGLLRTTDDGSRFMAYGYDANASRTARLDGPSGGAATQTQTYGFNDAGMLTSATSNLVSGTWTWGYDELGRVTSQTDPNSAVSTFTWRPDDLLSDKTVTTSAGSLAHWTYTYDGAYRKRTQNLVAAETRGAGTATPVTGVYSYAYDGAGRLTSFTDQTGPRSVTWDADSNRLTFGQQRFEYRADGSLLSMTDVNGANAQAYDQYPWGGMKTDGCRTYQYDGFDRTRSIAGGAKCEPSKPTSFLYDALDRQRSHAENGKAAIAVSYDGDSQWVAEDRPAGTGTALTQYALAPSGAPLAAVNGTTAQFLADDGDGNIALVTSSANPAQVACTARYDAFGGPEGTTTGDTANSTCNTGTTPSDLFWHAGRKDQSTGTYQFGSRTYDPAKGSYFTPDSAPMGTPAGDVSVGVDPLTRNRYSFVNGDPVNLVDPSGHRACLEACGSEADRKLLEGQRRRHAIEMEIERRQDEWVKEQVTNGYVTLKLSAEYQKYQELRHFCYGGHGKHNCLGMQLLALGVSLEETKISMDLYCATSTEWDACDLGKVTRALEVEFLLIDLPASIMGPKLLAQLGLIKGSAGAAVTHADDLLGLSDEAAGFADDAAGLVDDAAGLVDDGAGLLDEAAGLADDWDATAHLWPDPGDVSLGQLDKLGRARGIRATLDKLVKGTDAARDPVGLDTALGHERGHLLAKMLGGTGRDVRNLVPLFRHVNSPQMRAIEEQVAAAIRNGQVVRYAVTPIYAGSNPVPVNVVIRAYGSGGLRIVRTLVNAPPG